MAVTIKRERPDQRRHHRLSAPLFVDVCGHRVRAADWSLGGLRIDQFPGDLPSIGSEVELSMALPFQGFNVAFMATAEVVRVQPERGMFAVRFSELGERERELMAHFIEELVRGHMGDAADTIQRIDVPVTPASLKPDESSAPRTKAPVTEPHKLPQKRLPLKTIAMSAIYILLGLLVSSYAAILTYSNFFRMEVPTAVITAPVQTIEAQVDGRIELTGLQPGDAVESGDVLLKLIDGKLEREIELAEIAVEERKAKLVYLRRRHADELERVRDFAAIEMKNVEQTRLSMEAADASLKAANDRFARVQTLYNKGFATQSRLDEAREKRITLEKQLASKRIELATRVGLAENDLGKRLYTGDDLIGKLAELEAEVRFVEQDIELTRQRYAANKKMRDDLTVRAPFDGTIQKLPRFNHVSVRRGDIVAVVEQRRNRQVTAFLTQDEIAKVGLGDEALLYLPALGETFSGRVTSIDRTTGFIREQEQRMNPGYAWRGPADRSAQVVISFDDHARLSDYERYRAGLPVTVIFEQRTQNSILSSLAKSLSTSM